jgi:hypothetical protein
MVREVMAGIGGTWLYNHMSLKGIVALLASFCRTGMEVVSVFIGRSLGMLVEVGPTGASICPSLAVRQVGGSCY